MNDEINNIGLEQEQKGAFVIEHKTIEAITDFKALGVYTYMKMLTEQEITKVTIISELICKHFSINEKEFLNNVEFLNGLGLMMVIKTKD